MPRTELPSPRMIRAARGLLNLDQSQLAEMVGVTRRTIIRLETETTLPVNPRRIQVIEAIRDRLEQDHGIKFIYPGARTGEGVMLKPGD